MRPSLVSTMLAATLLAPLALAAAPVASFAPSASVPRAVIADPARDARYPASNRQVLILSHGEGMNALLMLAAGPGPKPTMLLLHGLPGNEQNLDLAQAVRRAGWNVLTLHYRGSWGSPGRFSLAGAYDDVEVAMAWLRQPEHARQYGIDSGRLVVAGHSMGGFLAARYAAAHEDVAGAVLIDPWNVGASGKAVLAKPEGRQDAIAAMGDDFGNSLAGTDAAALMAEVERHANDWDLLDAAPRLVRTPLLIVDAQYGNAQQVAPLVGAIKAGVKPGNGQLRAVTLASDHGFADHRIALAGVTVNWLDALRKPAAKTK
jgi:pimeloyl-ACP methyl ester carboxylesterase